jgi:hypothetical protein
MGIFFVSAADRPDFGQELALTGPSEKLDDAHWPARGDLAHIRLAGKVFVPHYADPLPYVLDVAAGLLTAPREDAPVREELPAGVPFNVLDIAGKWAWGQLGEDGCVGYLPMAALRRG